MYICARLPILAWIVLANLLTGCLSGNCQARAKGGRVCITDQDVEDSFVKCKNTVSDYEKLDKKLEKEGRVIPRNQKVSDISLIQSKKSGPFVKTCETKQMIFENVTEDLITKYNLTPQDRDEILPGLEMNGDFCSRRKAECLSFLPNPQCDSYSKYRTADGSCNHLQNPRLGSAFTCFRRLLPAQYIGASQFRQSVLGGPLPEPRDLSINVHRHLNRPTDYVTHMYMFFGQLLDHDISQSPISVSTDNMAIECCPQTEPMHPQCAPISIRSDDYFYSQFGTTCINFVRSAMCTTCVAGPRQQMNQITSYIDASFVYGNSLNTTLGLRANDGTGRLLVDRTTYGDLLPSSRDPANDQCSFLNTSDICFETGDVRANQHNTLTSLHTLFVREHNRLADGLRNMNPRWSEEKIFQEARRIVGAEMQVITYKEWLPITLGPERMTYFKLWLTNRGSTSFDPSIDPTLYNEFSGAAFRFGHSMINGIVTQTPRRSSNQVRMLRDEFFQPFELRTGLMDPLLSGVSSSSAQWFDRHLVEDVTNHLYRIRGSASGLDLASINIQRGRDHGLPTYTQVVRFCSENQLNVQGFSDLFNLKLMTYKNAQIIQQVYRHVDDIDLWTGVISEIYNEGAVVGPTAACLIGTQFNNLKFGDRFYFEHRRETGSFTYQQMEELRKVSLSKIICANTGISQIALNAMLFRSRNNPNIDCQYVRGVDLSYWREW